MTEAEMRDAKAPTPDTTEELATYIQSLVDNENDYGTCVYAMSLAATAAFNHVASKLGVSGFQASCADLDILKRTRGWERGFTIFNAEDLMYPQYDFPTKLTEWIEEQSWLGDAAREELSKEPARGVGSVVAHWEMLAAKYPPEEDKADEGNHGP